MGVKFRSEIDDDSIWHWKWKRLTEILIFKSFGTNVTRTKTWFNKFIKHMLSGLTVFRKHHTNSYLINMERHEEEKSAVNKTRFGSSAPKYAHFKILLFIGQLIFHNHNIVQKRSKNYKFWHNWTFYMQNKTRRKKYNTI